VDAYYTRPDAEAQRPVGPGGLLDSTGGAAFGQLSFYVRCERPVVGKMSSNSYDGSNWTLPDTFGVSVMPSEGV
jgi:hypothetical protein